MTAAVVMVACRAQEDPSTDTPTEETLVPNSVEVSTSTPTPITETQLTICTTSLPDSLFPYDGLQSISKGNILAILLEPGLLREGGNLAADILNKVPTQADGDLRLETVSVQAGQLIVDAQGELVVLKSGIHVRPSGCRQADCAVEWEEGAAVEMDQMVMDFEIKSGLTWSDGTAVTAADSVFSYLLASDPQAPGLKWAEERTADYQVLDPQTAQWVSRPGFTTAQLERFFWTPLPAHLFTGTEAWDAISNDPRWAQASLSYGPYLISSWESNQITLQANSNYYRAGFPLIEVILYKQIEGGPAAAWNALQKGQCDVLDASFRFENDPALLAEIAEDERFTIRVDAGHDVVQLVYGIQSAYEDHPNILGDALTRQGLAACLDRTAVIPEILADSLSPWYSFLPKEQSQLVASEGIAYNPDEGRALLGQAGWVNHDSDPGTPLQAGSVANVPVGTPLSLTLMTNQTGFHADIAAMIQNSLRVCGATVEINALPEAVVYAPGPEGPLFGRQFDLALIAWQASPELACNLYMNNRIPESENAWIGTNIAGFTDSTYDDTCVRANLALPGEVAASFAEAEQAYISTLPAVPLFAPPRISIYSRSTCNQALLQSDGDIPNHIEEFFSEEYCP